MHGRACTILPCSLGEACSLLQIALPVGMSGMMSQAIAQPVQQHCILCLRMPIRLLGGKAPNLCKASQCLRSTERSATYASEVRHSESRLSPSGSCRMVRQATLSLVHGDCIDPRSHLSACSWPHTTDSGPQRGSGSSGHLPSSSTAASPLISLTAQAISVVNPLHNARIGCLRGSCKQDNVSVMSTGMKWARGAPGCSWP